MGRRSFCQIPAFSDLIIGLVGFGAIARRVAEKAKVLAIRSLRLIHMFRFRCFLS